MSYLPALEAVIVGAFLFTSIVVVDNLHPQIAQPTQPTRVALEHNIHDLLAALDTISDEDYGDRMNRIVIELLNGNTTYAQQQFRRAISDQALYRLTLHNSRGGSMVLYEDRPPTGEFVGATVSWVPPLDTAFIVPELEQVDGDKMGLGVSMIALRNGYPINDRDIPVEVEVVTNDSAVYKANVGVRFGEQQVTMGLVKGSDVVHYESQYDTFEHTVRLASSSAMASGRQLEIRVPNAWLGLEVETSDPNWVVLDPEQHPDFWRISATLAQSASIVDFKFNASRPGGTGGTAFDHATVWLDAGNLGRADLLFRGSATTATLAAPFTRGIHLALPKVLVAGSTAPWSVIFANAQNETSVRVLGTCLGCLSVNQITIRQPGGLPIFTEGTLAGGWSFVDASTLRWSGLVELGRDEAHEFRVNVTPAPALRSYPFTPLPKVSLPESRFTFNLTAMTDNATHVARIRADFLNATAHIPGYETAEGRYKVCADAVIDDRTHQACNHYNVTRLTSVSRISDEIQKGLAISTLDIPNPFTSPGDTIRIEADFTHLMEGLLNDPDYVGARNTTLTIYYPWVPKISGTSKWPVLERFATTNESVVRNFVLPGGAPYGTYLVVAEKGLDFAGGTDEDQVVRKVGWFNVGVDGLTAPTVLYSLTLNAWLEDWG